MKQISSYPDWAVETVEKWLANWCKEQRLSIPPKAYPALVRRLLAIYPDSSMHSHAFNAATKAGTR